MSRRALIVMMVAWFAAGTALAAEPRQVRGSANVPCRLYIQDSAGKFFFARSSAPQGSAVVYDVKRSATSHEQHTTLSAHPFGAELPPGKYTFTAEHGKEHAPAIAEVTIPETGDVPEVKLSLVPWIDMHSQRWYSGDTHVHRKLEDLPNLIEAEDLHVALPLTYWVRAAYESPNQKPAGGHPEPKPIVIHSTGTEGQVERVIWPINTEYELFTVNGKSHTEGAVFVLNHKTPLRPAAPPVGPVAQAARDEGALLDLDKHSWNWSMMIVPIMDVDLYELANNHVWRTGFLFKNWTLDMLPRDWEIETDADGYTERGWIDWGFKNYYALLNCGFRMRPSGGTGAGVHPVPLGFGRVYVECPDGFSYGAWLKGLNAGRSFVTTGPMLRVTFDGQPLGTVFKQAKPHAVHITGTAESLRPLIRIEVIVNGEVARVITPQNRAPANLKSPALSTKIDEQVPLEHSSWIALRCFEERDGGRNHSFYAHTAPVHFEIDGPVRPREREVNYFIRRMEQEIARNRGVLADAEVAEYEKALAIYQEIAKRARP
ncbi:MAG: CehA/McbA family metallohydrolase [Planctomycetia bacterium]|nr:CehA/McbA family metallohydrolase [Planctomycetia bacterium]